MESVQRKIVHVKARPTYVNINNLIMLIKKLNIDAPKLDSHTSEGIQYFCDQVENLINNQQTEIAITEPKPIETFYKFDESRKLPSSVFQKSQQQEIQETEEEEMGLEEEDENVSGSEIDENSENEEEGYEFYEEEDDEAEFSD